MIPKAHLLQNTYSSWTNLAEDYLLGHTYWSPELDERDGPLYRNNIAILLSDPESPWVNIPWSEPMVDAVTCGTQDEARDKSIFIRRFDLRHWSLSGSDPSSYETEFQTVNAYAADECVFLGSKKATTGFGTSMYQWTVPDNWIGKRIKLSAYICSKDVADWAGLWMRVDDEKNVILQFDNMADRPIKATTDWKKYAIVLDIPKGSKVISFGILINGTGKVWLEKPLAREAGPETAVTGTFKR